MEDTQKPSSTPSRQDLESSISSKPCAHYCRDHSQALCADCAIDLDENSKRSEILDPKSAIDSLNAAKLLLASIQENSECLEASSHFSFSEEFKVYSEMLANIDQKLAKCISDGQGHELCLVMREILQLQKRIIESNFYIEFSKLKNAKMFADKDAKEQIQSCKQQNEARLEELNQSTIGAIREDIIQREKDIWHQEQKIQNALFQRIYERRMSEEISDVSNFDLKVSLADSSQKDLFKDIETSYLMLPKIKRIRIDNISDSDTNVSSFFLKCIPNQLKLLCINESAESATPIKSKFDKNSFYRTAAESQKKFTFGCSSSAQQNCNNL